MVAILTIPVKGATEKVSDEPISLHAVDFYTGLRSHYYSNGLDLTEDITEQQISLGGQLNEDYSVAAGAWLITGIDTDFSEQGAYLDFFYTQDNYEIGITSTYQNLNDSTFSSGFELGLLAGYFDENDYFGAELIHDFGQEGLYFELNYTRTIEWGRLNHHFLVASSWVANYANFSSFHDLRAGWGTDLKLNKFATISPSFEYVSGFSEENSIDLGWLKISLHFLF